MRTRTGWQSLLRLLLGTSILATVCAVGPGPSGTGSTTAAPPSDETVGSTAAAARVDPAVATREHRAVPVIVQVRPGGRSAVAEQVRRSGGTVTADLPLVEGFAARLPGTAVPALARHGGVAAVSADRAVRVQGGGVGVGSYAPEMVRAPQAWAAGRTGRGVTVALVDTGVATVPDLAGRIVPVTDDRTGRTTSCYDLSGTGTCRDDYGHGTFMAGLIAGNGASGGGRPTGTAPEASVLSVKVAGPDGAADVSTVLAAIQWVVSFKDRYGVRVLNLSLGTDSAQSWRHDPLNYAVERAWDAGILVVVAASNRGPGPSTISKPADDPWVVTVGAVDDRGTAATRDDRAPDFSSRGPAPEGVAKPDVVAPGARVLSLRAPGSTIDRSFAPAGAGPYRAGSGTSMAAAVVSGVAAVALQAQPSLVPDQLKYTLVARTRPVASDDRSVVGAGLVDAPSVAGAAPSGRANAGLARSSGRGSLGASRGSLRMTTDDPIGAVLTGRQTAQLLLWDPLGFTTRSWTPSTWYTSVHATVGWNTAGWVDPGDSGPDFPGHNWTGHNWTGHNWTGSTFYGQSEESTTYGRTGAGSASYGAWD